MLFRSYGFAIALLLTNVIRYNAADIPAKQTAYSQYDRPQGVRRYAEIARHLGLHAEHDGIAEAAFDDQCSGANPRFPLISELRQILLDSYYGRQYQEIAQQ